MKCNEVRLGVIIATKLLDGCAFTLRWPDVLLKLKLVARL